MVVTRVKAYEVRRYMLIHVGGFNLSWQRARRCVLGRREI